MNKQDILKLSIHEAHEALLQKNLTVKELCTAFVEEAKEKNGKINAFLEFFEIEAAINRAQSMYDNGTAGPLCGMPIALKDNMLVYGQIASASSRILENYVAPYEGDVVKKLKDAGVVIVGRTNMDEFAMGSSTENSAYGVTKNPLDTNRVPGGSSGGSAASVAMGGAIAALGSDTGGSIRQPASFCGLVGLYPTYGAVSRYGLIAMGSSLDQIGPFTKTVADAELLHVAIAGHSDRDAQTVTDQKKREQYREMKKKIIGVPRSFLESDGIDPKVKESFEQALAVMQAKGYTVKDISLPHLKYSLPVYYVIMPAEVSSNLARLDGVRYGARVSGVDLDDTYKQSRGKGFGEETRRRIMLGTYVLSSGYYDAYYGQAQKVRAVIREEIVKLFEDVDLIATPTTPTGAFKIGEKSDPLSMYMADIFTVPANIAGVPAITVPFGIDDNDMPLGIQFFAPHFNEERLFTAGKDLESGV